MYGKSGLKPLNLFVSFPSVISVTRENYFDLDGIGSFTSALALLVKTHTACQKHVSDTL